ncbi:MAG TPA: hypothetical protein DCF62_02805 [Porticoccaceae bacterium]|nr:hypothetical protein [Porticoccaceae bacterium]HCO60058.1 hypothetical protein [Porticoccaceae bacterium]
MSSKLSKFLLKRYQVPPLEQSQADLVAWLNSSSGRHLFEAEQRICQGDDCKTPGYRVMQLGCSPQHSLIEEQAHVHKFILASRPGEAAAGVAEFHQLPLPSKTLDTVMLHHALDFSPHPHVLLNEAARVVNEGGFLIIVGFNPFSLFGLTKWWGGLLTDRPVWRHNSLRRARLVDWLRLIGFEAVAVNTRQRERFSKTGGAKINRALYWWRWQVMSRAFYVLVARQRTTPLSPIRQGGWQPVKIPALHGLKRVEDTCPKK